MLVPPEKCDNVFNEAEAFGRFCPDCFITEWEITFLI